MPRDENGQLVPGTVLAGRYRIEKFLAGGGMGLVYLARDQRLSDRPCAVKEMFDRFTDVEERRRAIEYFHREADTLAQLGHPAIPAIFDRFGEGNCHYLVMDYVRGTNLEDELKKQGGCLPESRVLEIARQLCDVLTYLHSFHPPIIYRDMKPGNVILTPEGRVVLIDFGIARIFSPQGKATLIGTPGFAPPEQYAGKVDERSDLYGLAATLHYILTGRDPEKHPPFSFPPVRDLKPEVSAFLARTIDLALSYEPDQRPPTAAAFKEMMLYGRGLEEAPPLGEAKAATRPLEMPLWEGGEVSRPPKGSWGRRLFLFFLLVLLGTGGYSLYAYPEAAQRLGHFAGRIPWERMVALLPEGARVRVEAFVENLPWKREERLRALRADPLELVSVRILNTTRDGQPLSEPKEKYTEDEIRYLTWEAVLKNRLAGLEGARHRLEGRFFDPEGMLAGKSQVERLVRAEEKEVSLKGVTLISGLKERAKGDYQFELYLGERKLATQKLHIAARPKKAPEPESRVVRATPKPPSPTPEEEERLREEARRLALIRERSKKPLDLIAIRFLNTTREGKRLSGPSRSFSLSKVRFVAWEAVFRNRLHRLLSGFHRVEAQYYGPDGRLLGTVQDLREVPASAKEVTFTARLGNSQGGAFLPGTYRVDFYLDGRPFTARTFQVEDDRDLALLLRHHRGSMRGLVFGREVALEVDFRPQAGGVLGGELVVHEPGYGVAPLSGRVSGERVEFQSPFGRDTYYFLGIREGDRLSGTFVAHPSGARGNWSVRLRGSS